MSAGDKPDDSTGAGRGGRRTAEAVDRVAQERPPESASADTDWRAHLRQARGLSRIGLMAITSDVQSLIEEGVATVAEVLDVEYAKVLELLPGGTEMFLRAGVGWSAAEVGLSRVGTELGSQAGYTLLSAEPVVVEDLRRETRFHGPQLLLDHGVVSGMSVVIHGDQSPFGVLGAHTAQQRRFAEYEVDFLQAVANVLAQAIERDAGRQRESEAAERLRIIVNKLPAIVWTVDSDLVLSSVSGVGLQSTGVVPEEFSGRKLSDITGLADLEAVVAAHRRALGGERVSYEITWLGQAYEVHLEPANLVTGSRQVVGLARNLTEARQLERAIATVAEGTAGATGALLFEALAAHLARALGVRGAFVGEILGGTDRQVRTLALFSDGKSMEKLTYRLCCASCLDRVGSPPCRYPNPREEVVPSSEILQRAGANSAACVPLVGSEGRQLGLLAALDDKPFPETGPTEAILRVFAQRAAAEIERLRSEEERVRLSAGLEQTSESVLITDRNGRIVWVNPAFERLTGYTREEAVGQTPRLLKSGRHDENFYRAMWETISRGETWLGDLVNRRKDGTLYVTQTLISPVKNDRGEVINFAGLARDVTRERAFEEQLRSLNATLEHRVAERTAELRVANRELEAFSYSVSHDLRSPVRSVLGFSSALLEDCGEQLDQAGREYLDRIRRAGLRMNEIIGGLLSLAGVSHGHLERAPVNIGRIVGDLVEDIRNVEPDRAVEVVIGEAISARADERLLRTLLDNLLRNAWKYSSKTAYPRIEVGTLITPESAPTVYFVRDNGAGFDMKHVGRLFTAFHRLHAEGEFEGIGIGLAIVARIVQRHGGRVWAEGETGKGATFYFTLDPAAESKTTAE